MKKIAAILAYYPGHTFASLVDMQDSQLDELVAHIREGRAIQMNVVAAQPKPTRSQMRHQRHRESLERTNKLLADAAVIIRDAAVMFGIVRGCDMSAEAAWLDEYGKYKDEQQKAKMLSLQWQPRSDNRSDR